MPKACGPSTTSERRRAFGGGVFKASDIVRFLLGLLLAALLLGLVLLRITRCSPAPHPPPAAATPATAPHRPTPTALVDCASGPAAAAQANAASLATLAWAPFGRPETGWETYAPLIAREIGTACAPQTPGFAAALATWQAAHQLPADGVLQPATFEPMRVAFMLRRPFVQATRQGACPAPPPDATLATATQVESYGGMTIRLRPGALDAYRRLVAAARQADPRIASDRQALTLISGFRDPADEAGRCVGGACNRRERASCSAHRTGLALDLYLGAAPGYRPDSSADPNRLWMSRTPAYRWLVANAGRFGFLNYPFEPWHWEWTGEAP
jgi:hypothetical protein